VDLLSKVDVAVHTLGPVSTQANAANDNRELETMTVARQKSEILAATIYLISALTMLLYLRFDFYWVSSWAGIWHQIVALFGGALLLVASIRVFMARRFADLMALVGALLAWPYFRLAVFYRYGFSSWVTFNLPGKSSELHSAFFFATLTILAISTLVASTAFSALRLTPRAWRIGKLSIRDRAWPGLAVTFLFVVTWYLTAVTPYQIPIFDFHQIRPIVSVLHVQKHGLQFHETSLAFYRDGEFYLAQSDRRLFQYSFQRSLARGVLTEDYFRLLNGLANSPPEFGGSDVSSYVPPNTWNADRWFVSIQGRAGRKAINKDASVVPKEVLSLFFEAQKLPQKWAQQETARDVCLGFCYDPTY
jgi:hypothetical protein